MIEALIPYLQAIVEREDEMLKEYAGLGIDMIFDPTENKSKVVLKVSAGESNKSKVNTFQKKS